MDNESFGSYVVGKCSQSVACFFLNSVLHRANVFTFYISFISYFLMDNASVECLRKVTPGQKFSPMFPSKSVLVLHFHIWICNSF